MCHMNLWRLSSRYLLALGANGIGDRDVEQQRSENPYVRNEIAVARLGPARSRVRELILVHAVCLGWPGRRHPTSFLEWRNTTSEGRIGSRYACVHLSFALVGDRRSEQHIVVLPLNETGPYLDPPSRSGNPIDAIWFAAVEFGRQAAAIHRLLIDQRKERATQMAKEPRSRQAECTPALGLGGAR